MVLLKLLQTRLAQYHEGDHEGFRSHVAKEAKDLARLPFGVGMLHSIGYASCHHASWLRQLCQAQRPRLPGPT